jgi:Eukaryotic protein of unknown function (DUF829)
MLKSASSYHHNSFWRRIPTLVDPSTGHPRPAQAVIIVMGWWGAQPAQLDKYVHLYQEILPAAAVVAGTANPTSILWKDDAKLAQFAKQGLEATAATLVECDNKHLPIMVHVFSNGGGYVWHQMMHILDHHDQGETLEEVNHPFPRGPTYGSTDDAPRRSQDYRESSRNSSFSSADTERTPPHANTTIAIIRQNIQCQIYDSSPAYFTFESSVAALEGSGMIPHKFVRGLFKCWFLMVYWVESLWDRLRRRPHRLLQYWNDLLGSDLDIPQGFIYSQEDRMVDADHLQDFIQERQRSVPVSVLKFEDSPHVQHYRYHPEEYKLFVSDFLHQNLLKE